MLGCPSLTPDLTAIPKHSHTVGHSSSLQQQVVAEQRIFAYQHLPESDFISETTS